MPKQKHTVEVVKTDLEIDEDLDLHEKGWKVQRVGWVFIFALVILASFGFFGDGLVSKKKLSAGNIQVEYDRFHRHEARMDVKFDVNHSDSNSTISFNNQYLKNFKIESIMPEPKEVKIANDHVNYLFNAQGHSNIVFYLIPQQLGSINGIIQVNGNQFDLSHFIYP